MEGMQSTIYFLQQQLKEAKETIANLQKQSVEQKQLVEQKDLVEQKQLVEQKELVESKQGYFIMFTYLLLGSIQ